MHLITNNQIGFTTDPSEGRSTRYSSDLAKGFDVPIIHVNADDPEAAVAAVRLAMAYRKQFAQDVVIDLVGYRRFGHNEQDEAAYTQPLMVEQINAHPSVRELYQAQLVAEGVLTSEEAEAFVAEVESVLRAAHERLRASIGDAAKSEHDGAIPRGTGVEVATAVAGDRLTALNEELLADPGGLHRAPEARAPARAPPRRDRRGRHRLGPGRSARLRVAARRRDPRSG